MIKIPIYLITSDNIPIIASKDDEILPVSFVSLCINKPVPFLSKQAFSIFNIFLPSSKPNLVTVSLFIITAE